MLYDNIKKELNDQMIWADWTANFFVRLYCYDFTILYGDS